jgi:hypothetical protein
VSKLILALGMSLRLDVYCKADFFVILVGENEIFFNVLFFGETPTKLLTFYFLFFIFFLGSIVSDYRDLLDLFDGEPDLLLDLS